MKKNRKKNKAEQKKQKKRAEIFSSDDENSPPAPGPSKSTKNKNSPTEAGDEMEIERDPEVQDLIHEAECSKARSFWQKKDKSKKVEILAPDTPELDRRGPKTLLSSRFIVSDSD